MSKHKIERTAPVNYRVPENIPPAIKYHTIVADPPWTKNQTSGDSRYGGAVNHYPLMKLDLIKKLPVSDLAADDAHLYLWVTNSNIDEGLEVIKAWGFHYITMFHWIKPKMGVGNYFRNASETCLFAVRGKLPPKFRSQINWLISYPTSHSQKPREGSVLWSGSRRGRIWNSSAADGQRAVRTGTAGATRLRAAQISLSQATLFQNIRLNNLARNPPNLHRR